MISAANLYFQQGADDSNASISDWEKPSMRSGFSYNYWIDTIEVTQGEYLKVTGRQPIPDTSQTKKGDSYPVSYVTWYDAILFCNAKSRENGLDTVYAYFVKDTLPSGAVNSLTGLITHFERDGFRLPTEAEWEFAAREGVSTIPFPHLADTGSARRVAWFDINSSNTVHPVGQLQPNKFGLYDMAGNVFEWTDDWKGPYSRKGITNSIGAPGPDSYFERTLKGGSFKHSFLYLRPSRRSGTYQTSLSTTADFIGFRCARGPIPIARYCTADTNAIVANPVVITSDSVRKFLGAMRAKLVFVNVTGAARTLCSVDFGQSIPSITQYFDIKNVFVPTISPDGKYVAFCNRGEGLDGPATVSIRSLDSIGSAPWKLNADSAYVPRWWIDKTTNDTFLIYTNSAIDDKSAIWQSTKTFLQKISGGRPLGSPQVLVDKGSFHDGLSSNHQFIVTGFTQCIMRDFLYDEQHQLFLSPYNGKDALGSTQVCNVSISPDPAYPDRCLFLDFGSQNQISTLTQSAYGTHQCLFISEYSGKTLAWYKCPATEASWDFPEWSNKSRFAIACVRNGSDDAHAVYAINLETSASFQILEGTELNHPYLWLDGLQDSIASGSLSIDSLGIYNNPFISGNQVPFSYKMHLFWEERLDLDVVFIGSSQTMCGIDCRQVTGLTSLNMGYASVGVRSCANIVHHYLLPSCPKLKVIGMSSAVYWLGNSGGDGDDTWTAAIMPTKGYQYDLNHNFWRDSFPAHFNDLIIQAPFFNASNLDSLGGGIDGCQNWGGQPDLGGGDHWNWPITDTNYARNIDTIVQLIQDCAQHDIHLLMINFPESPAYKSTDHFTRAGPSWATGEAVVQQLKALENTYANFHFYDAYNNGNHDYTDADASNWNHLCATGAAKLTARINPLIHSYIGK
jgi:uncharacterized protein (TIGR02171 family)